VLTCPPSILLSRSICRSALTVCRVRRKAPRKERRGPPFLSTRAFEVPESADARTLAAGRPEQWFAKGRFCASVRPAEQQHRVAVIRPESAMKCRRFIPALPTERRRTQAHQSMH
jgi:hypothetical protein